MHFVQILVKVTICPSPEAEKIFISSVADKSPDFNISKFALCWVITRFHLGIRTSNRVLHLHSKIL
jgi:hypothetical protein